MCLVKNPEVRPSAIVGERELRKTILRRVAQGEISESYAARLLSPASMARLRQRKLRLEITLDTFQECEEALEAVVATIEATEVYSGQLVHPDNLAGLRTLQQVLEMARTSWPNVGRESVVEVE
jgi:hypothetical protein